MFPKPTPREKMPKPLRSRLPPRPAPLAPGAPTTVGNMELRSYDEIRNDQPRQVDAGDPTAARKAPRKAGAAAVGNTLRAKRWGIPATPKASAERRAAREFSDPAYLAWVRRQPCKAREIPGHRCWGRLDPHHAGEGLAHPDASERKTADRTAIPICRKAHREVETLTGSFAGMDDVERRAVYDRWIAETRAAYDDFQIAEADARGGGNDDESVATPSDRGEARASSSPDTGEVSASVSNGATFEIRHQGGNEQEVSHASRVRESGRANGSERSNNKTQPNQLTGDLTGHGPAELEHHDKHCVQTEDHSMSRPPSPAAPKRRGATNRAAHPGLSDSPGWACAHREWTAGVCLGCGRRCMKVGCEKHGHVAVPAGVAT